MKPQVTKIKLPDQPEASTAAQPFEIYDDDGPYALRTEESIEVAPPDETANVEGSEVSKASKALGHLLTPEETPKLHTADLRHKG